MKVKSKTRRNASTKFAVKNKGFRKLITVLLVIVALTFITSMYLDDAHRRDVQRVSDEPTVIAAVGDSITDGTGERVDDGSEDSYPSQLKVILGNDYEILSYGVGGATLLSNGAPYTKHEFFKLSQETKPDIVLIMLGTNDSRSETWNASEYERQLKTFIDSYRSASNHPEVYVMTPPAAYGNKIGINGGVIASEIVPIIYRVAAQTKIKYIDIFSLTKNNPELFRDGVHPSYTGYKVIANKIATTLRGPDYSKRGALLDIN